jgi:Ser/Thr protein kinase RdoA (MazF antagonist)
MAHQKTPGAQVSAGAVEAATRLVRHLGLDRVDPTILHESQHISIRLSPLDIVARVVRADQAEAIRRLNRELAVVRHLVEKSAPVIGPTSELPAGPHFHEGFALTLWQFVDHVAADGDNAEHAASAAAALRRVHEGLADFRDDLPSFWIKIEQCFSLLENESALPALGLPDRRFLQMVYRRLRSLPDGLPINLVPIHGDAHFGNVFITSDGARWNDFADACTGPREWDIGWLPNADLDAFEPVNRDLLSVIHYLRSWCVSIWCWDKYDMPEKREGAEYHLWYLRQRFG